MDKSFTEWLHLSDVTSEQTTKRVLLRAENIGGIESTEVAFSPGVTILPGENATNRTSLLQAIMAGVGSTDVALKGDAEEGRVELVIDGETYSRTVRRTGDSLVFDGEPYVDDPQVADLFAFLLESNEARSAVERGEDLRELIMRPVDTEAIERQLAALEEDRRQLDADLEELEGLREDLPTVERERDELRDRLQEKRDALAEKEAEIDALDRGVQKSREDQAELDEKIEELRTVRSDLEDVRYRIESERESIESLETRREELGSELGGMAGGTEEDPATIESEIDRLRERRQTLDASIKELQNLIQFNERMSDESGARALETLGPSTETGSVTDQLLDDAGEVVCWTCGSSVPREQIDSTIDRLSELRQTKLDQRADVQAELDELNGRLDEIRTQQSRRADLERRLSETTEEIETREERLDALVEEREKHAETLDSLEAAVETLKDEEYSKVLEFHREANQLEFEIERTESDLEQTEERIASIEDRLDEKEALQDQRASIQAEITDLRTRVEQLEEAAVEQFNDHMATVLGLLEYENVERIWLERTEREVREGRRKTTKTFFDLHVVRTSRSGAAYEDSIDHLSESEQRVTGLVFALAGYLVHDVHETVPFVLLDSLEAIDALRIARLVEYFSDYAAYVIVALLPEDASALSETYNRVTDI